MAQTRNYDGEYIAWVAGSRHIWIRTGDRNQGSAISADRLDEYIRELVELKAHKDAFDEAEILAGRRFRPCVNCSNKTIES